MSNDWTNPDIGRPLHTGRLEVWACTHYWQRVGEGDPHAEDRIGSAAEDYLTDSGPNIALCSDCVSRAAQGVALRRQYVVVTWRDGWTMRLLEVHDEDLPG